MVCHNAKASGSLTQQCLASLSSHLQYVFFLFIAFFWLAYTPFSFGASSKIDMAVDQKKQVAARLLKSGLHSDAFAAYMQLLREVPQDDEVNFGIIVSAVGAKEYAHGLMACERLIDKYPRSAALRLQMAKLYLAVDEKENAIAELQKAKLFDPSITDEIIQKAVDTLESQGQRFTAHGQVSAGVLYDTNSNQGPRSNTLSLGGYSNLFVDGIKRSKSWGNYLSGMGEFGYRTTESGPWWFMGGVQAFQRWNTSGVATNNQFSMGKTSLGFRYVGEKSLLDARVRFQQAVQTHKKAKDRQVTSAGPELTWLYSHTPDLQFITYAAWEKRDYDHYDGRDGQYWDIGEYVRYFFGEAKHSVLLGIRYSGTDTKIRAYNYKAYEPTLAVSFRLPYSVTFTPSVSFREEVYAGPATGLEKSMRLDNQWRFGGSLSWEVTKNISFDASYQYIKNDSNSALYRYNQDIATVGMTWRF